MDESFELYTLSDGLLLAVSKISVKTFLKLRLIHEGYFRDTYKKFQGKQNPTILDVVFADIKKNMYDHNITPAKLTKEHLVKFLRSTTGYTKYIEDNSLIYYKLTGHQPPDISHLESSIDALYKQIDWGLEDG